MWQVLTNQSALFQCNISMLPYLKFDYYIDSTLFSNATIDRHFGSFFFCISMYFMGRLLREIF